MSLITIHNSNLYIHEFTYKVREKWHYLSEITIPYPLAIKPETDLPKTKRRISKNTATVTENHLKHIHCVGTWRPSPCRQAVHQTSGRIPEFSHLPTSTFFFCFVSPFQI